jgi:hypothetical protein
VSVCVSGQSQPQLSTPCAQHLPGDTHNTHRSHSKDALRRDVVVPPGISIYIRINLTNNRHCTQIIHQTLQNYNTYKGRSVYQYHQNKALRELAYSFNTQLSVVAGNLHYICSDMMEISCPGAVSRGCYRTSMIMAQVGL